MKTIFINITDYPMDKWSQKQINDVRLNYNPNKIIDMGFPSINPEWELKEINALANRYEELIIKIKEEEFNNDKTNDRIKIVVHIMGEPIFVQSLVCKLAFDRAIICIASANRIVNIKNDNNGNEIRKEFYKFRNYYN